ncbi:MAG: SDR family oxidoreductase [Deltaproteobacteria bacterium]
MTRVTEVAVVVGASGAFGAAIVKRLVDEGLEVLAVARDPEKLAALADGFDRVAAVATDILDDASVDVIREAIGDRVVRAVVHGPGVIVAGGILEAPPEAIVKSVDIKVGGLLRVVRAADERFVEGSRIIAIAGHYGLEPSHYAATAGVANAAVFSVVRQLSLAYGPRGVTAHTLAPGPSDTERLRRVAADRAKMQGTTAEAVLDEMRKSSSIGRFTTPEQVAWSVATLLAPEASAMTGSTIMLDSGRRKGLP